MASLSSRTLDLTSSTQNGQDNPDDRPIGDRQWRQAESRCCVRVLTNCHSTGAHLRNRPTVAIMQWRNEIEAHSVGLDVLVWHGSTRETDVKSLKKHDVILTTYAVLESCFRKQQSGFKRKGMIVKEKSALHAIHWNRVIVRTSWRPRSREADWSVSSMKHIISRSEQLTLPRPHSNSRQRIAGASPVHRCRIVSESCIALCVSSAAIRSRSTSVCCRYLPRACQF